MCSVCMRVCMCSVCMCSVCMCSVCSVCMCSVCMRVCVQIKGYSMEPSKVFIHLLV